MINEIDIPIPRWTISDPFGRAAIRRARWEYKRKAAECAGLRAELDELYSRRDDAIEKLTELLRKEKETSAQYARMFRASEEARKSQGAKIQEMLGRVDALTERTEKLTAIAADYDALVEEHEKLVRAVTDKEAVIE